MVIVPADAAVRRPGVRWAMCGIGAAYPTAITLVGVVIAAIAGTLALRIHSRAAALCLAAVLAGAAGAGLTA